MGFPILVRWHLDIESGPCILDDLVPEWLTCSRDRGSIRAAWIIIGLGEPSSWLSQRDFTCAVWSFYNTVICLQNTGIWWFIQQVSGALCKVKVWFMCCCGSRNSRSKFIFHSMTKKYKNTNCISHITHKCRRYLWWYNAGGSHGSQSSSSWQPCNTLVITG